MVGIADLESADAVDTIVLFCLFTVRACSPQRDKVFGACLNTTAVKECLSFHG